jgi:serine/threonine protein kinase
MLIRLDEANVSGVFSIDGYISVEGRAPRDIASLIVERLQILEVELQATINSKDPSGTPSRYPQKQSTHTKLENNYEVDHVIFTGHFSRVFKCRKRTSNDICIVKETVAENVDLDALYALKNLDCPNVAAPKEIWQHNGKVYEELPYIGGVRLSHAVIDGIGGLSGALLESFHERMMVMLERLHAGGIVHRDIHPDNIYLVVRRENSRPASFENVDEIRIWDTFGGSDPRLTTGLSYLDSRSTFAIAWVLVDCTFATLITEQQKIAYRHGPYTDESQELAMATPASDIYALGATIFYSITGTNIPDFRRRKAGEDPAYFPNGKHPSTRFSRHLAQLLSLNPDKRPLTLPNLGEDTHTNGYTGALRLSEKELLILDRFDSQTRILKIEQAIQFFEFLDGKYKDLADAPDIEDRQQLSQVRSWIRFLSSSR